MDGPVRSRVASGTSPGSCCPELLFSAASASLPWVCQLLCALAAHQAAGYVPASILTTAIQGRCTASDCPYLHVNVSASAPVCKAFLRGYCMAGADCPHKHYTLGMVKEERRLASAEQQQRARRARAGGDGARGTEVCYSAPAPWRGACFLLGVQGCMQC